MNDLPNPPSERDLPDQQRRRAELIATIGNRPESSRRRAFVPLIAAASVLALVGGGTLAGQALQGKPAQETSAASASESSGSGSDQGGASPEPPPETQEMAPEEQEAALRKCVDGTPGWQEFEPIFGLRFDVGSEWTSARKGEADDGTTIAYPKPGISYLVARDGDEQLVCTFDADGNLHDASRFGSHTAKDIPYLFAPVDSKGPGFGMHTGDVAEVTLQKKGGPERAAVLHDGYYLLPIDPNGDADGPRPEHADRKVDGDGIPETRNNDLIGVTPGYVIRGYDENGDLVYSSEKNGPKLTCYTDPAGEEVLVHNDVDGGDPAPEDCRRTLEWTH